jgi:hypothetical protein
MSDTQSYIKALVMPTNGKKAADRKSWSISLQGVWLPFFIATNAVGNTQLAPETLGAPLRLAHEQDGTVRFSKSGRPVIRVVKELGESIRLVRDNFVAGLVSFADNTAKENPDAYMAQVEAAREAGQPIIAKDNSDLATANAQIMDKAMAEATKRTPRGRRVESKDMVGASA